MIDQTEAGVKTAPNFSHRIDQNFYESMAYTLRRAEGLADMMEVAGEESNRDALGPDTLRAVAHTIRMKMADAKAMLEAWKCGWR